MLSRPNHSLFLLNLPSTQLDLWIGTVMRIESIFFLSSTTTTAITVELQNVRILLVNT